MILGKHQNISRGDLRELIRDSVASNNFCRDGNLNSEMRRYNEKTSKGIFRPFFGPVAEIELFYGTKIILF